ncbi:carboxypeptidase-like regulatory domain-containing protein [Paludibacter sp. 221]|uniref:DUF5686 and carboxypeptidase-like regulatory domain-containing protein n=1 Tax=Paludibacter sp. 221 TaxID=2302939 RepID=UPI0013CF9FC7|nr:DUF5686 and carboxypeptidase-like regulatory domain-containing protein [Paludibacter sp. 221]NDV47528.1 carboxypeptidase-like regulatory domain-containing protein [Paludibacter sp. 221]
MKRSKQTNHPAIRKILPESFGSLILLLLLLVPFLLSAQTETLVTGQIVDKYDKTPIPYVNIYFKNSNKGAISNDEGYFIIRSWQPEKVVVFSSVGYKTKEVKIKPGVPVYLNIELTEENTWISDVFVYPGVNPALEWMKRIRLQRKANDITNLPEYSAESTEQSLVLISKIEEKSTNKRLYEQFKKGNLSGSDSSLTVPLYMAESKYQITPKGKKQLSKNKFSSPQVTENLIAQITGGIESEMNFYNNSVSMFGKSIISPLSNIGNSYYNFYLADSTNTATGKEYEIHFRTKNPKNLALNGKFRFDSTSLALTYFEGELPRRANINFVHGLSVKQEFEPLPNQYWVQSLNDLTMSMNYEFISDTLRTKPELFIKQSTQTVLSDSVKLQADNFAQSQHSTETLDERLQQMDNTPLMRTAKWIADAAITSYVRVGVIDVGRLQQVIRLTDIEGVRLNVPVRTNEHLWKNISIGGYAGYGFRNKEIKYSAFAHFRLPTEKRRVIGISYTDDYRRIDYNYNDFIGREDPWNQGDQDAINTIFSFRSGRKMNPRKEWSLFITNDWNKNIESSLYLRHHKLLANSCLPITVDGNEMPYINQQSVTLATRFSSREKSYEDHLQRLYIGNRRPVVYAILEAGQYQINGTNHYYGKAIGTIKQKVKLNIGQWDYMAKAGWVFGKVPYPLLEIPAGSTPGGISFYNFNQMEFLEFAFDKYISINNEFIFNGLLFNNIPLIKHLNLRELIAIKVAVGDLSDRHKDILDFPQIPHYMKKMQHPYVEGTIGITNLLRVFTIQLNWRFTNLYEGIQPWRVGVGLRLAF